MSEQLIYAMSTRTKLSLNQFYDMFKKVYLPRKVAENDDINVDIRLRVIRSLDSLGYCEFDFSERRVYMCPPSLVLLSQIGTPKTAFVGARTPSVLNRLKSAVRRQRGNALITHTQQGNANINIPGTILIDAVDKQVLDEISKEAGIRCYTDQPCSWKLANFSKSIEGIDGSLDYEQRQEPGWRRKIFMKDRLVFNDLQERNQEGYDLAEYKNPINHQLSHWIWNGTTAAEVERDWGRYILLFHNKRNVLLYDEKGCKLAVPVTVPLPCVFARALTMCSGMLPSSNKTAGTPVADIPPNHPLQVYKNVTPEIVEIVARKLGQIPADVSLTQNKHGVTND